MTTQAPAQNAPAAASDETSARILIFTVAYNAEKTLKSVLERIPESMHALNIEVLVVDDSSPDNTFSVGLQQEQEKWPFPLTTLRTPVNQGYGGNQKLGYRYAIANGFDYVVLLHGDGQYAPEVMADLVEPLLQNQADAVFGSRMMNKRDARAGGMPLYKWVGNQILTNFQNRVLKSGLTEFHSGYRVYSTKALEGVPFENNSNDFHFDTQIIIQLLMGGYTIKEVPIPTFYGDEICHVNGLKYALDVVLTTLRSRLHKMGLLYERRYDVPPKGGERPSVYQPKFNYPSSHTFALAEIRQDARVLDIGGGEGQIAAEFVRRKNISATILDSVPEDRAQPNLAENCRFEHADLDIDPLPDDLDSYDQILMLDILEHLRRPEDFLLQLRRKSGTRRPDVIISCPNIAFFITRFMLLLGQFNYGPRGILDRTHTRLFTFGSLKKLLMESGFLIEKIRGVPAPYPLAIGDNGFSRFLLGLNKGLIRFMPGLFSYQIFIRSRPLPTVPNLLRQTIEESDRARRQFQQKQS